MISKYGERIRIKKVWCLVLVCAVVCTSSSVLAWKPAKGPLMTRWAKDVSPDNVHPEYPRPQMVRKDWLNLNGLWDYAIVAKDAEKPEKFDGEIMVPFPCESALSGVMKPVGEKNRLWYRRVFEIPSKWKGRRVLLHFGAVDWDTTVWINGKEMGRHKGGYDPFTFDITDALKKSDSQEIVLSVWDPTNDGTQPRGKQVNRPGGIWYTAVTGIWQTVWLEPVATAHIESLKIEPDVGGGAVVVRMDLVVPAGETAISLTVLDGKKEVYADEVKVKAKAAILRLRSGWM